jgi:hypothetical protein
MCSDGQEWDTSKKIERIAKALYGQDLDGVSSIDPDKYHERFLEAMKGCACLAYAPQRAQWFVGHLTD